MIPQLMLTPGVAAAVEQCAEALDAYVATLLKLIAQLQEMIPQEAHDKTGFPGKED